VIGVDEVGRGPLAGPVVAAAVASATEIIIPGILDSKQLKSIDRELLELQIKEKALAWAIGETAPQRIDEINILQATGEAMCSAIRKVLTYLGLYSIITSMEQIKDDYQRDSESRKTYRSTNYLGSINLILKQYGARLDKCFVNHNLFQEGSVDSSPKPILLIDGRIPDLGIIDQINIIKGDTVSFSIAAASILAKVYRDREMVVWDSIYPIYGFASNKGYGTRTHIEAIRKYGRRPIHRQSFKIRSVCRQSSPTEGKSNTMVSAEDD